jgi:hypothetical protein
MVERMPRAGRADEQRAVGIPCDRLDGRAGVQVRPLE